VFSVVERFVSIWSSCVHLYEMAGKVSLLVVENTG